MPISQTARNAIPTAHASSHRPLRPMMPGCAIPNLCLEGDAEALFYTPPNARKTTSAYRRPTRHLPYLVFVCKLSRRKTAMLQPIPRALQRRSLNPRHRQGNPSANTQCCKTPTTELLMEMLALMRNTSAARLKWAKGAAAVVRATR